jgi:hypothetical protein
MLTGIYNLLQKATPVASSDQRAAGEITQQRQTLLNASLILQVLCKPYIYQRYSHMIKY